MKQFSRALALGFALILAQSIPSSLVRPAASEEVDLGGFVDTISSLQTVVAEGSTLMDEVAALDTRISDIYYDGASDTAIDEDLTDFERRIGHMSAMARARLAVLQSSVDALEAGRQRTVLGNAIDVAEVLLRFLGEAPEYLDDLLVAARTGDAAEFDRLSRRSMLRASALLRTESAMLTMQQETIEPSHPSYALLACVAASNEAMALFTDAGAEIFERQDVDVARAADAMRVEIGRMRGFIEEGTRTRRILAARLFVPSFKSSAAAGLRSVIETEFADAIAIEVAFADHLDDLARALEGIYEGDYARMQALDEMTIALTDKRMRVREAIITKMQKFAADL